MLNWFIGAPRPSRGFGRTPPEIVAALKPYIYSKARRIGALTEFSGAPPALFESLFAKYKSAFKNANYDSKFDSETGTTMRQVIDLAKRYRGTVSGAVAEAEFRDDGPWMYVDSITLPVSKETAEKLQNQYGADEVHKRGNAYSLWWD